MAYTACTAVLSFSEEVSRGLYICATEIIAFICMVCVSVIQYCAWLGLIITITGVPADS